MASRYLGPLLVTNDDDNRLAVRGLIQSVDVIEELGYVRLVGVASVFVVHQGGIAKTFFKPGQQVRIAFRQADLPARDEARNLIPCGIELPGEALEF